jgi:hypothetical protein
MGFMTFGTDDNRVYLVPLIDVNWLVYAPFDPGRDFRVDPPKVEQSVGETRGLIAEMRDLTDGKFILTPHSGTYCRTGYYEGEMLDVYREAVAGGGELSVHLHEEIKGVGTRYAEWDHVEAMFLDCKHRLEAAGIRPIAYRGGHCAYHPFMNKLLTDNEIYADYSCCPLLEEPTREAIWTEAELSAGYLPENPREPWAGQPRSKVLEIPIGSDGEGAKYRNFLQVEQSDLENLTRIWDTIVARAEAEGRPQIVHCLFHTGSVGKPEWIERYRRFLDMVPKRHGQFVTTLEARLLHERLELEAAA